MSKIEIPWKATVFDSQSVSGSKDIKFFHGAKINHSYVDIRIEEEKLVNFISKNFKQILFRIFEVDNSWKVRSHIVEPFTKRSDKPGDIDLLIFNPKTPEKTISVEVKVLRKRQENFKNDFVDNINRLREGLDQAEGLANIGFHSVFIMPIIISNTSISLNINLASRVIDSSNWEKIRNLYESNLEGRKIGFVALEICQNTERPIYESGIVSGFMYRKYTSEQPLKISELVRTLKY